MNWKTKKNTFLIQKNAAQIPFIAGGVGLENGEKFDRAFEYYELTAAGIVVKKFGKPISFSLEDELIVSGIHLVIGDSLYDFYWRRQYPFQPILKVKMLSHGLCQYEFPLPFDEAAAIRTYEEIANKTVISSKAEPELTIEQSGQQEKEDIPLISKDRQIAVGCLHITMCDLEIIVYDYDLMDTENKLLPVGTVFKPWKPLDHWREKKIPVTLGTENTEFDWGVSSCEGHFIEWNVFFENCEMIKIK